MDSMQLRPAGRVWYNGGSGDLQRQYALVVGADGVSADDRLNLLVCNNNGVWEYKYDVPHVEPEDYAGVGDGSGGHTWYITKG